MPMLPSASSTCAHRPSPGTAANTSCRRHADAACLGLGDGGVGDVDPVARPPGAAAGRPAADPGRSRRRGSGPEQGSTNSRSVAVVGLGQPAAGLERADGAVVGHDGAGLPGQRAGVGVLGGEPAPPRGTCGRESHRGGSSPSVPRTGYATARRPPRRTGRRVAPPRPRRVVPGVDVAQRGQQVHGGACATSASRVSAPVSAVDIGTSASTLGVRRVGDREPPPAAVGGGAEHGVVRARRVSASASSAPVSCGVSMPTWSTGAAGQQRVRVGVRGGQPRAQAVAALGERRSAPSAAVATSSRRAARRRRR